MKDVLHKSRFIIANTMLISLLVSAWWSNFFSGVFSLDRIELAMISFLFLYFFVGIICSWTKKWNIVRHIANGLPMWALTFTGIGIINAAIQLTSANTDTLIFVFKHLALAISPNIVGVFLMVWLREIALWCANEET